VESTINSKIFHQQADGNEIDENLCADAGFVGSAERIKLFGYIPHIRPRNVEADMIKSSPTFKPRRWVVEAFFSWLKRFRKIHVRYEKTLLSYWGLVCLACAIITFNKISTI
jgi:transposase